MKWPSLLAPERPSGFHLTTDPRSLFRRSPIKPRGLSDSCAEPLFASPATRLTPYLATLAWKGGSGLPRASRSSWERRRRCRGSGHSTKLVSEFNRDGAAARRTPPRTGYLKVKSPDPSTSTGPTLAAKNWRVLSAQHDTEGARASSHGRRATRRNCDFARFLIPEPVTRSSRNRLNAVVDLIFDALPDLVGAHGRIFH